MTEQEEKALAYLHLQCVSGQLDVSARGIGYAVNSKANGASRLGGRLGTALSRQRFAVHTGHGYRITELGRHTAIALQKGRLEARIMYLRDRGFC